MVCYERRITLKLLSLDPATKTGWAFFDGNNTISGVFDFKIKRDESGGMRLIRFKARLNEIYNSDPPIDIVVFEAARHAGPHMQGALVVQAELQGVLKSWCEEKKIEYRGYSPKEIKKHATGSGNANKDKMLAAAKEKWPDIDIIDDNMADSLFLLDLARKELL